jgi:hypothetical protein
MTAAWSMIVEKTAPHMQAFWKDGGRHKDTRVMVRDVQRNYVKAGISNHVDEHFSLKISI